MDTNKVFITGFAGMVGSHLADYLFENTNLEIHGFVRWQDDLENIHHLIEHINNKNRIFLHYGDLNDSNSIYKVVEEIIPKMVFHLAAQSYPLTSFNSSEETYNTNILGTERLLLACKRFCPKAAIHVCSSSEVFGKVPRAEVPINENCSFHPASPYAISKVGTDLIGRYFGEAYNMKVVTTRMFTHTGPRRGDVFAESSFAKQIAMIEKKIIKPQIYVGNLDSMRTWADVRDAVRAYYLLLMSDFKPGDYYNIGGDFSCTIREMLNKLISLSNYKDEIKIMIDSSRIRPIDADLQIPDMSKFKNHINWSPRYNFDNTMKDLLNYWRFKIKTKKEFLRR